MPEDAEAAAKAFASSFVEAVAKTEPAGDPEVQVVFGLGWHMAELYLPGTWSGKPPKATEQDLPGLSDFSARQHAQLGLDQVDVTPGRLRTSITEHGLQVRTTEEARKALSAGLGGVLASLGLTWKGVGMSLGKTAGNLERLVWGASLDTQIAAAITELPGPDRPRGLRRRRAATGPSPTIAT